MRSLLLCSLLGIYVLAAMDQIKSDEFNRMLTHKTWTLVQYGIDENENGRIDAFEDHMDDCNRDDTYVFYTDGTGRYDDHKLSCGNGIAEMSFQWRLPNDHMAVSLPTGAARIESVIEDVLVLTTPAIDEHGEPVQHIRILKHQL